MVYFTCGACGEQVRSALEIPFLYNQFIFVKPLSFLLWNFHDIGNWFRPFVCDVKCLKHFYPSLEPIIFYLSEPEPITIYWLGLWDKYVSVTLKIFADNQILKSW